MSNNIYPIFISIVTSSNIVVSKAFIEYDRDKGEIVDSEDNRNILDYLFRCNNDFSNVIVKYDKVLGTPASVAIHYHLYDQEDLEEFSTNEFESWTYEDRQDYYNLWDEAIHVLNKRIGETLEMVLVKEAGEPIDRHQRYYLEQDIVNDLDHAIDIISDSFECDDDVDDNWDEDSDGDDWDR